MIAHALRKMPGEQGDCAAILVVIEEDFFDQLNWKLESDSGPPRRPRVPRNDGLTLTAPRGTTAVDGPSSTGVEEMRYASTRADDLRAGKTPVWKTSVRKILYSNSRFRSVSPDDKNTFTFPCGSCAWW